MDDTKQIKFTNTLIMKTTTTIRLSDDLELEIEGYYEEGQSATYTYPIEDSVDNVASQFEINDIEITKGTLLDLIDNLNGNLDLWDYLTELTIKEIEGNEGL